MSPALTGGFFTAEPPGKPRIRSGRRQKSKRDLQPQQEGERGRELFTRGRKRPRRDSGCSAGGKEKPTLDPGDRQTMQVFLGSSLSSRHHHLPQTCCFLSYSLPAPLSQPVLSCRHQMPRRALPWSPSTSFITHLSHSHSLRRRGSSWWHWVPRWLYYEWKVVREKWLENTKAEVLTLI